MKQCVGGWGRWELGHACRILGEMHLNLCHYFPSEMNGDTSLAVGVKVQASYRCLLTVMEEVSWVSDGAENPV